ncbi:maleylpyruvate isomerase family mycothiol-dependent enzyme [Actinoplanes sp. NPDC023936]|uniref:maleylpyruvate isomerase family mycothiol-dependent enzyme n=1 Tax=Actinoplanes sp. NPDC023936 TaxID=3154910 RepID=UPI0033F39573
MKLDHLTLLRRDLAAFRDCLDGDLTATVEHCGGWTLADLAAHLGQGNLWAATAVTERRGDHRPPAPATGIGPWFTETAETLLEALDVDPATEAWTFAPPRTAGFWQRRRCLETVVHLWDAQHALGTAEPLDPALAGDGIAEVIEVFVPRMIKRGLAAEPVVAVRFTATDLGTSWMLGPGDPVAEIDGTAEELMLALWNRRPIAWERLTGDEAAARAALRGPLVP